MKSNVRFINEKVRNQFNSLQRGDKLDIEFSKRIWKAITQLNQNPFCGIQIQKRLIPKIYKKRYNIDNLWKIDISRNWRLLYSIINDEVTIIALIIEWLDHKEYERIFQY